MMGVVEEKSSRVVEILLPQVRPSTLLSGKVLGLGIFALAQMLILCGAS
ncbi:MAG: ABC-2 type transport system permease protein [Ilumatobacter sp.]|jgi:ABC-2 type transport system permease protein